MISIASVHVQVATFTQSHENNIAIASYVAIGCIAS